MNNNDLKTNRKKTSTKKIVIWTVGITIIAAIGVSLLAIAFSKTIFNEFKNEIDENLTFTMETVHETLNLENIENLDIISVYSDISIKHKDVSELEVTYTGKNKIRDPIKIYIDANDTTATIKVDNPNNTFFNFNFTPFDNGELLITLPNNIDV